MSSILKKIIHIDDDPVMRMMVKKALERADKGFEIASCATAAEFYDTLHSLAPDLLVVDVLMPITNGPSLIKAVREKNIQTPVVFMTGQDDPQFGDRDQLEPIIGIIRKPFSPLQLGNDLLDLWERHLRNS